MAQIVIIGAGLTGLSTAYHLEQQGFTDYKLFEKEATIGGLCRSVTQDGFTFDFTGHLLHTSDPYFRHLIETLVGLDNLNAITRQSFIYSHDVYTRFPFQVNLFGLPHEVITECIEGYINRSKKRTPLKNYHEFVLRNFGAGFGKQFFFPYQQKIFAYDTRKLTAEWTGRFVPPTSLPQIIKGALCDNNDPNIGYNSQFLYPKHGGIISWVQKFADQIQQPIYTNHTVSNINSMTKTITFSNGHSEHYEQLITTIPLDRLVNTITEKSSLSLKKSLKDLRCNSVVNFNLGVNRPDLSEKHWIYFPEQKYPFYRIGFPHNFAKSMAPDGCSSLYGEFSYTNKSRSHVAQLLEQSLASVKKILSLEAHEIMTEKIIFIPHAYVIYNQAREIMVPRLLQTLAQESIYSVGRYGEWKYASMQEAVLDGQKIAQKVTSLDSYNSSAYIQKRSCFIKNSMH